MFLRLQIRIFSRELIEQWMRLQNYWIHKGTGHQWEQAEAQASVEYIAISKLYIGYQTI